jgi:hypothetical protein
MPSPERARSPATRGVEAWAVAELATVLSVPATYAFLRARDALFGHEPNPATVIWSARVAMFWRLGIAAYVAGMIFPLAYFCARRDLARTVRVLYALGFVAAAMIVLQGLLLP